VRVAFDTSVLVPALVRAHPRHARAHVWLDAARTGSIVGVASWHAFAESWAVFTRLPLVPRLSGGLAKRMLHRLQSFFDLVEPSAEVYEAAVARCVERGRTSGAVFDALHLVSAETAAADALLTFNLQHFRGLRAEDGPRLVVPPDPPGLHVLVPPAP